MPTISPQKFHDLVQRHAAIDLIDVRTPVEFRAMHVHGARPAPLDHLDPKDVVASRPADAEGPTYILCKTGKRAQKAAEKLAATGDAQQFVVVEGGIDGCLTAGIELERGPKKVITLERQVRIVAGLLVAIGTALGVFINPWFLVLPAFVGCGLAFAGITDTCGMAMMLAKMPWNR